MSDDKTIISSTNDEITIDSILNGCPCNATIGDNLVRAFVKINNPLYENLVCSISGGADSDIVLDICTKVDKTKRIRYIWFNTGLEYQATKDHLKELEQKYDIVIEEYRPKKAIPTSCKENGQPFLSKNVSEMIRRLQKHNFKWEDKSFDELYEEYPTCKSALEWWCNTKPSNAHNIKQNKWLKEFMVANPPKFAISNLCCKHAKKDVAHQVIKDYEVDLEITGIRKAEGGARATAYKSCFDCHEHGDYDRYRPIFWYKNEDKEEYQKHYGVVNSRCYTEYGLKRTGCAGCPFGRDFEYELEVIQKYEPKLFKAVNYIFGDSYEYTRKYREFVKMMNEREKNTI